MKISPLSIVISTVLISSIGIGLYTFTKNMTEALNNSVQSSTSQMENIEIQAFNSQFESYEGNNIKGNSVYILLSTIINNNAEYYDNIDRIVGVTTSGLTSNVDFSNVTYKKDDIIMIQNYIDRDAYYSVEFEYTNGFITSVNITKK